MKTEEIQTAKKKKRDVKVIVQYEEQEMVYYEDQDQPIGVIRNRFACEFGLREEEFRFVTNTSGYVLTDTDIMKSIQDVEDFDVEEEAAAEAAKAAEAEAAKAAKEGEVKIETATETEAEVVSVDKLGRKPEEEGAKAATPEDVAVEVSGDEVKVKKDSSDEEKKRFLATEGDNILDKLLGFDKTSNLISEVCRRCVEANRVDKDFIHQQSQMILRAVRLLPEEQEKEEEKPRGLRLTVVVQEGFPLFMVTKHDGIMYMACLGHDTMQEVRDRFARLIDCETKHLVLRKHDEEEILSEDVDAMTMDELGMENGCAFDAERTGLCVFNVIFDFVACIQVRANLDKPIESLMKKIEDRAPAFKGVRFYFWYNGNVLPDDVDQPLGKFIIGCHFLRVMVSLDTTLQGDIDMGPDMIVTRPKPRKREPTAEELEATKDMTPLERAEHIMELRGEQVPERPNNRPRNPNENRDRPPIRLRHGNRNGNGGNGNGGGGNGGGNGNGNGGGGGNNSSGNDNGNNKESGENGDDSPETPDSGKKKRPVLPLDVKLNGRVLRYMTLLVECNLVENMRPDSPHHAPITLPRCLPNMTVLDLKKKIAKLSREDPDDQTLFYNGKPIDLADNYTSLRELDILGQNSLYMEPPIDVYIDIPPGVGEEDNNEPLKMRRGQKSTTIADVYEWISYKRGLEPEEIHLEIKGVCAVNGIPFSDYAVEENETFVLLRPFRLRVWHGQFLYDKVVWKHTTPQELMADIQRETEIPAAEQVFTFVDTQKKTKIALNKPSLYFCGIESDEELEVWRKSQFDFHQTQQKEFKRHQDEAPATMVGGFLQSDSPPNGSPPPQQGAVGGEATVAYPHFLDSHDRPTEGESGSDDDDDDDYENEG